MSVKIRLAKTGKKHQISFRVVAQDSKTKRDGKFLEILGFCSPKSQTVSKIKLNHERIKYWIAKGAKPTASVAKLIKNGKSS